MPSSDSDLPVSSTDVALPETPGDKLTGEWAEISTYDAPPPVPVEPGASTDPLAATDPAASPAPSIPDARYIQHYELIRELGRGGMGVVHLARDLRLGRLVAIKMLTKPGHHQERFLAEARATARCRHENIVVIHDVGIHGEQPYLVFEYLRGQTLRQWMEARTSGALDVQDSSSSFGQIPTPLTPTRAVEIILPVVRALVCAHDMGIIHRDLKPANILLTEEGITKVLDFGVAKIGAVREDLAVKDAAGSDEPLALTALGARLGTLPYMSPEQLAGEAVDHRSDIWPVGIILYELVTGAHPLAPLSMPKIHLMADVDTPMPSVREHRSDLGMLADIISRCLLKDRKHRTDTARELLQELEALLPAQRTRARDEDSNPFAGLATFQESDADRFFGRDHEVSSLIGKLRNLPLVAVTGPSGAGKSSLVRAGVIPALKRSGEGWEAQITRPGRQPLAALAEVLLAVSVRSSEMPTGRGITRGAELVPEERDAIIARLRTEPGYLGITLRTWARAKLRRVVLLIDQFEELYTLGADTAERACVLACLSAVADDAASPLRVILSVRSDFLDRMVEQRAFLDAVSHGLIFLPPLDRSSLREALIKPVEACDYRFESPDMVERILDELEATRSPLPLLQFTADKLWARRGRGQRILTESSLHALGGVSGALAGHADAILASMPGHDARLARTVFLRLVTPERTRALATLGELRHLSGDTEGMNRVLSRLIDARLLAVDNSSSGGAGKEQADGVVEIVHESLIDTWPLLTRWLAESEEDAVFLTRLRSAARDWQRSGQDPGLLWTGQAARDAQSWCQRYQGELAPAEEQYIKAVVASVERQRRVRRLVVSMTFAAVAMVATIMTYLAWQEATARDAATEAAARATQEAKTAQQVSDFLINMFEAFDPYKAAGTDITARQILDRGTRRIDTELRDQPVIRARLMHIMGVVYGNLGVYAEAIALLEQALATRQKLYGLKHLEVAETQHALADVLTENQAFTRAEALYRDALDTRRALLGEEQNVVAQSLHGLANVLLEAKKPEEAEPLARQTLKLRRQLRGQSHPDVADSLQLLGTVLMVHKDYAEAERVLREAVGMYRQLLGDDALEVAETMHLLAKTLITQERYADAEALLEQSLAIQRRILGEDHISLAHGLSEQAEVAVRRGEIERAEALFQKALGIYRASLDTERMPMANILSRLAQLAERRGDHARATPLAQEAVNVARQAQHVKSRYFAAMLADLAFFQYAQGQLAEAEAAYREALAIYGKSASAAASDIEATRIHWIGLLIETGKLDEAAPLVQTLEKYRTVEPDAADGWLTQHARSVLGAYLSKTGQSAPAEELLTRSYAALQESRGARDRHTRAALGRLITFYEGIGIPGKAEQYIMPLRGNGATSDKQELLHAR
jgi:serine/threonine protein kinase/tetratricopeptide (TPR) repeat protein